MPVVEAPAEEEKTLSRMKRWTLHVGPGLAVCALAVVLSLLVHKFVPSVPALTASVALGIAVANIPGIRELTRGRYRPGLAFAGKKLMRFGIILLGLKLSVVDVLALGWTTFAVIVAVVVFAFLGTYQLARWLKLPGDTPVLLAAGFSICGASAIGAMAAARRSKEEDVLLPVTLVTLCGTLAIAVLPLFIGVLSLSPVQFGQWAGASVHDVGQVVATAQVGGAAALAAALVIKLTRVLMLAPMVFGATVMSRRRSRREDESSAAKESGGALPPLVPLFIVGFVGMILIRSSGVLSAETLNAVATLQDVALSAALFGLGSAVRLRELVTTGVRGSVAALLSWILIAALGYGAVLIIA